MSDAFCPLPNPDRKKDTARNMLVLPELLFPTKKLIPLDSFSFKF